MAQQRRVLWTRVALMQRAASWVTLSSVAASEAILTVRLRLVLEHDASSQCGEAVPAKHYETG